MRSADDKLVQQCLAGDTDAFGALVHKYQEMVYAYASQKIRNDADAQDITQEVFLRAYRHLNGLKFPHQFRSWLYTIMSNECNRWLARTGKSRSHETTLEEATDNALQIEPEHARTSREWDIDVEQALEALPQDNRIAVSMFYMSDCSMKEIGEFLGVSVNTVKGKLHRARQQLGKALSERYEHLVKDHKLQGGFLMQVMNQLHQIPHPVTSSIWSGAAIKPIVLTLITALCVLMGFLGLRSNLPPKQITMPIPLLSAREDTDPWATPITVSLLTSTESLSVWPIAATKVEGKRQIEGQAQPLQSAGELSTDLNSRQNDRSYPPLMAAAPPPTVLDAEAETIISGRVLTTDDAPIADAQVYFFEENYTGKDVLQLVGQTTADGAFQFQMPTLKRWERSQTTVSHPQESLRVIVHHSQYAFSWKKLKEGHTKDLIVVLGQSTTITGKVTDDSGNPLDNVHMKIAALFTSNTAGVGSIADFLRREAIPIRAIKSGRDGHFVLPNLPADYRVTLHAVKTGYAVGVKSNLVGGTNGVDFALKPEGRIEGRVIFHDTGKPAEGITIHAQGHRRTPPPGGAETETDENGYYALTNLVEGTYNVFLNEDHLDWTAVAREYIEVVPGKVVKNMNLELIEGGWIVGKVIDRDTNEPIAGHSIGCHDAARPESQAAIHGTTTDENGMYRFRAAPGKAMVYTSAPEGYQDVRQIKEYVNVVEGETAASVDFQFQKGIKLIGRVHTSDGEPVEGAKVLHRDEPPFTHRTTDKNGEFVIGGLRPGRKLWIRADHPELQLRGFGDVVIHSGVEGVEVEILMGKYEKIDVSGRVANEQGKAISSANISLTMTLVGKMGYGFGTRVAVTDDSGSYKITGLIAGDEYQVSAEAKGYESANTGMFKATAEMSILEDLVLSPVGR